jgi:hypothetical protein
VAGVLKDVVQGNGLREVASAFSLYYKKVFAHGT